MKRRQFAALAAAAVTAPQVLAQDRTIKILVGFPPGGSADIVARLLADKMRVIARPDRGGGQQARRCRPRRAR